jgi:hypothetical protein
MRRTASGLLVASAIGLVALHALDHQRLASSLSVFSRGVQA